MYNDKIEMNHLCFIVDNSLTMGQCPYNAVTLLDTVKNAIESAINNWARLGFPGQNQHIHLFATSHPYAPISSFQHDQSHLIYQFKSIVPSMRTDPATTIQTALNRISHFRLLTEAQTVLGYRQAYIFESALIIFFTDRMTRKKIQSIRSYIDEGKIQLRSQYQFVTYVVSQPAFSERNMLTQQNFKQTVQNQKDLGVLLQSFRRVNGECRFSMHPDNLINYVWSKIQNYKPFLFFNFELKQMKRKGNQFVNSDRGTAYFRVWQQLTSIPFQMTPSKLWKIPLPFEVQCVQENGQIKIQKLGQLKFSLDMTKKYTDTLSNILPENRYKILPNPFFSQMESQQIDESYPIFFEHKSQDCLVGLLRVSSQGTQAIFFFGNFTVLNGILKNVESQQFNHKYIENSIYPYLLSLPTFYLKFIKILFDKLRLQINYSSFEDISNTPAHAMQVRMEATRSLDKKNLAKLYQSNFEAHQKNRSQCCAIYSANYEMNAKLLSNLSNKYDQAQLYFSELMQEVLDLKVKLGIHDYITSTQVSTNPMTRELQKYSSIKRIGEDQFNENMTFGNPYKKKKKVHSDSQLSSSSKQSRPEIQKKDSSVSSRSSHTGDMRVDNLVQNSQNGNDKTPGERGSNIMTQKPMMTQIKPTDIPKQFSKTKNEINQSKPVKLDPRVRSPSQSSAQPSEKKKPPAIQADSGPYIPCATVEAINKMKLHKEMEVHFNTKNLMTSLMKKNKNIMDNFIAKRKRK